MVSLPGHADAIVVGAGTAGAVVAERLAGDGRRVVLIEAGPGGPRPPSLVGLDLIAASAQTDRHWNGLTVRDAADGPARPYRQGFGLGGGSMINGMVLSPGDRADYQRWAGEWGCDGWGPDDLAPWLDRAAAQSPSSSPDRGPVSSALADAAAADGLDVGGTSLDADRLGVLSAELSATDGRRWSAADARLGGDGPDSSDRGVVWEVGDGNLVVAAGQAVERIGPDVAPGRHRVDLVTGTTVDAPLIVVCAGALGTPALLARSGIDERPIGRTMLDHPSYAFTLVLRSDLDPGLGRELAACPPVVSTMVRWSSGPDWPGDLQAIVIDRVAPPGYEGPPLAMVAVGLMAVTARGAVQLDRAGSGSPELDVVTGALGTASDRRRLRDGVRRVGRWLASAPFSPLVDAVHLDDDARPLADLETMDDAALDRLIASRPGPYAHPAGTCPLGRADEARSVTSIEDGRLGEVIGRPGIRLADASIFPDLVRGGLQLPVTAVASRIATDIIDGA